MSNPDRARRSLRRNRDTERRQSNTGRRQQKPNSTPSSEYVGELADSDQTRQVTAPTSVEILGQTNCGTTSSDLFAKAQ